MTDDQRALVAAHRRALSAALHAPEVVVAFCNRWPNALIFLAFYDQLAAACAEHGPAYDQVTPWWLSLN